MAITWRNIEAPDFNSASRMMDRSADSFDKALNAFQNIGNDQRNMNLFKQGEERASNIQSGKEAILNGSATLDDWKNLDLGNTLEPYQDTKTREALMDFFNQRDDTLREETKADLSIDQANQSMRLADAQNKRAIADEARKDVRLNIDRAQAGRQAKLFNQQQNDYFTNKASEAQINSAAQLVNRMVADNIPEDEIRNTMEDHLKATNPDGSPMFTAATANTIKALTNQGIVEFNTLTTSEQQKLTDETNRLNAHYNLVGIGTRVDPRTGKTIPAAGLDEINLGIQKADEVINNFTDTEKNIIEQAAGYKSRNEYLAAQLSKGIDSEGNLEDLKTEVNDAVNSINDNSAKKVFTSLTTGKDAISKEAANRFLKDNPINEQLVIAALSATTAKEDWFGEDYDIENLAPFKQKLELDSVRYLLDKFRVQQAKGFKLNYESAKSRIESEKLKEINKYSKALKEAPKNKKIILGSH